MDLNRAKIIDEQFTQAVKKHHYPCLHSQTMPEAAGLTQADFIDLFHSQCISRHLDIAARRYRETGQSFYTIGSSGHEGNAAIAHAFDVKNMAFLHYRSGAFMAQRAKQGKKQDYLYEQLLSLMAAKEDTIAGGRHKVFGSLTLNVPPQTSTIASHLPKAVGAALSISWANHAQGHFVTQLANESCILCSFGDASANHSTALGAFQAAAWIRAQDLKLPIVFICEDNGLGISVPTPTDWIEKQFKDRCYLHYITCDGRNLADVYQAACQAREYLEKYPDPVFLHMKTVRLMGHAGSDIESHYRTEAAVQKSEADDPLLHSAHIIEEHGWMSNQEILALYESIRSDVQQAGARALLMPKLTAAEEIKAAIIPPIREYNTIRPLVQSERIDKLGKLSHWLEVPRNMAQHLNLALTDLMLQYPNLVLLGEDVGHKGGVYGITQNLQKRFGTQRIFDTLLDEQTILGTAIGFAHNGFIPMPEIQFLAYTYNAVDQIRGEAATLPFFSNGQFTNPMVIRIPAFAYQKGFGGHFHNDNAIAFLREIPGIIVVTPSQAKDAACLLRESVRLATIEQRVVVFLEPIALYMVKDRYVADDRLALQYYPEPEEKIAYGTVGIEGDQTADILIISYANGMHLSRQAAHLLQNEQGMRCLLLDIRWLHPLPLEQIRFHLANKRVVLIVDECRQTGSLSETLMAWMCEQISPLPLLSRICAEDSFVPLGDACEKVLPCVQAIVNRMLDLV